MLALPLWAGFVGPQVPVSTPVVDFVPTLAGDPRIASNGDGFLVVWGDVLGIRAVRLDVGGAPIDDEPALIATRGPVADVASDGRDYVVATWCGTQDQPKTCFLHYAPDTGTATMRGAVDGEDASIASDGTGYLVTYRTKNHSVDLVPLHADGTFAGAAFSAAANQERARIASNGEQYYLVFVNSRQATGVLASEAGELGQRHRLSNAGTYYALGVASDGDDFLVTFSERLNPPDLRVTRVSRDGVAAPATSLLREGIEHSLAWSGSRYVVTYTAATSDVRALEVSASGTILGASYTVAATGDAERGSVVAGNSRATIAVWHRDVDDRDAIVARRLDSDAPAFVLHRGVSSQGDVAATNRAVAWREISGSALTSRVFLQRLGSAGEPLDGRGVAMPASARHQITPAIGRDVIAWVEVTSMKDDLGDLLAMRLDANGLPAGTPRRLGTAWAGDAVTVAMDDLVIWHSGDAIVGMRTTDAGEPVRLAFPRQRWSAYPSVASSDAGFLLLWDAGHVQAFSRNGHAVGPQQDLYAAHQAVWNGTDYVVFGFASYGGGNDATRVRRFSVTGIQIGDDQDLELQPLSAVAWSGSEYRLAYVQRHSGTLWIARLDAQFRTIDAFPALTEGNRYDTPVLTRDLLFYLNPYVPGNFLTERVVARRIGEGAAPPRRRTSG